MSKQKMFNYLSGPNKIIAKYNVFIQLAKINRCIATYKCPKDENILTYVFAKTCMETLVRFENSKGKLPLTYM